MTELVATATSANRPQTGAILVAILVIVRRTKPIFELGQEFYKSNSYMKSGGNRVIND